MAAQNLSARIQKRLLSNGVTLLHQPNLWSKAFCIGVWLKTGSRDERAGEEGLCHFLEHMLFKGTLSRSSFQISQAIEKVGGAIDAFTTKELVCIYVQVPEDHQELAIDVMSDMLSHSTFQSGHVKLEKQVVLEEINDVLDSPDDVIYDLFSSLIFPGHPVGRPILGLRSSVSKFSRKKLVTFWERIFTSENIVVSICGNSSLRKTANLCERYFNVRSGRTKRKPVRLSKSIKPERKRYKRQLHQQHICMGNRGYAYSDDRRFPLMVLTTLLGGGMSSRLFQKVREEMGLAYTVYSFAEYARDTGLTGTYMAIKPANTRQAVQTVFEEFRKIATGELKPDELRDTKEHLKGRILLGLETASARMMRMARNEIYFGRQVSEREAVRMVDKVTRTDVIKMASRLLDPDNISIVSLGPSSAGLNTPLS